MRRGEKDEEGTGGGFLPVRAPQVHDDRHHPHPVPRRGQPLAFPPPLTSVPAHAQARPAARPPPYIAPRAAGHGGGRGRAAGRVSSLRSPPAANGRRRLTAQRHVMRGGGPPLVGAGRAGRPAGCARGGAGAASPRQGQGAGCGPSPEPLCLVTRLTGAFWWPWEATKC